MTHIVNDPLEFANDSLRGFAAANREYVVPVAGGVVTVEEPVSGRVSLVVGGGSGHYPAFAGWVGPGLAQGAVCGNVFASPSASQVASVIRTADAGAGTLVLFGNYAGDVLHFTAGAEETRQEGIDVRTVAISDDIASNDVAHSDDRRGIAGDLLVVKVAGAAAARGDSLDDVHRLAEKANRCTRSIGVAFSGCTMPGADEPLFTVEVGTYSLGLGIHGEAGLSEHTLVSAVELAQSLVQLVLAEEPDREHSYQGRVAVLVNGLGATGREELFILYAFIEEALMKAGVTPVMPVVDEQVSSLDMAGVSLSVMFLDEELEQLWCSPCDSPAFHRGAVAPSGKRRRVEDLSVRKVFDQGSEQSRQQAERACDALAQLARTAAQAEQILGRLDAIGGDGDHGQGMVHGSSAAARAAREAVEARAGLASTLKYAGQAWADGAGGTSGALWGEAFAAASEALSDDDCADEADLLAAIATGAEAIQKIGGAKLGEKTMVGASAPFAQAIREAVARGDAPSQIWKQAVAAAQIGADMTANEVATRGRARTHGDATLGHPDPGAVSFALLVGRLQKWMDDQGAQWDVHERGELPVLERARTATPDKAR
ncbi:MAG: dihydroxyacetone kinase family protein [Actinomycetaceae bacterium]|nr:dihydroxyacetone kinase family protein [Actinomycetaceae bacterium]MDY5855137.1 dihydroxyacetone kinase family protein [Arcanobacterium sp.]